jgi:SAM-dependent methyltransferase
MSGWYRSWTDCPSLDIFRVIGLRHTLTCSPVCVGDNNISHCPWWPDVERKVSDVCESSEEIRATVLERFTTIANTPYQAMKFPVGPDSPTALGYDVQEIGSLLPAITESFCGVGNPLGLAALQPGHTVLDLGSGAGLDSVLAARSVGPTGEVIGVDMTEAMIAKARRNVDMLHSVLFRRPNCYR